MNTKLLVTCIAASLFSLSAHASDCSGGVNGGMDATGNQCNDPSAVAMAASSDGAALPTARLPKVEANSAVSNSQSTTKRTAATRHTSTRVKVKNS